MISPHSLTAMLQAALHRPDDAMQSLRDGIDKQDYWHLSSVAWLAYAAVCDAYGFAEEAKAARTKAEQLPKHSEDLLGIASGRVRVVVPVRPQ